MATKAEEVTEPSTSPPESKENPSEPSHEKVPESPKEEEEKEPVIIPIISDEVQPNLSNENQSLKLPR